MRCVHKSLLNPSEARAKAVVKRSYEATTLQIWSLEPHVDIII